MFMLKKKFMIVFHAKKNTQPRFIVHWFVNEQGYFIVHYVDEQ